MGRVIWNRSREYMLCIDTYCGCRPEEVVCRLQSGDSKELHAMAGDDDGSVRAPAAAVGDDTTEGRGREQQASCRRAGKSYTARAAVDLPSITVLAVGGAAGPA